MRCVVTLKDGNAMERAMGALAKYRCPRGRRADRSFATSKRVEQVGS